MYTNSENVFVPSTSFNRPALWPQLMTYKAHSKRKRRRITPKKTSPRKLLGIYQNTQKVKSTHVPTYKTVHLVPVFDNIIAHVDSLPTIHKLVFCIPEIFTALKVHVPVSQIVRSLPMEKKRDVL
jgi:hypothetical protein